MSHQNAVDLSEKKSPYVLSHDWILVVLSLAIQLVIGYLFGHIYDVRIFMSTGYLVGTGQNPYIPQDLSNIFQNISFQGITSIGYPPPEPLLLGLIYQVTYRLIPNFLFYNLAIKIPVISANICLAYLVANKLRKLQTPEKEIKKAWLFFLFNPFLLFASAAWGQIDSLVALFSILAIFLYDSENFAISAIFLALAISFKPTALPLVFAIYIFLRTKSLRQNLSYCVIFTFCLVFLVISPFFIFRWDPAIVLNNWNAHFTVGGGMSYLTFLELFQGSYTLPGFLWLVGILWMPILLIASFLFKSSQNDLLDLLTRSTAMILIFFLTSTWLSEPNIILILPFSVMLNATKKLDNLSLTLIWVLPLIFSFFNTSFAQIFFPSMPEVMGKLLLLAQEFNIERQAAKIIVVIPWIVMGWSLVIACLKNPEFQKIKGNLI